MKNKTKIALGAIGTGILAYSIYKQNKTIEVERFVYRSKKIKKAFDRSRILLVSDLHNCSFGNNQKQLLEKIDYIDPDYIFICGDLVCGRRNNKDKLHGVYDFIEGIKQRSNVIFVSGNHEAVCPFYVDFINYLKQQGVIVLEDEIITIEKDHEKMDIIGCLDPKFHAMNEQLYALYLNTLYYCSDSEFKLLLAHRPEYFSLYANIGYDVIFSGHAHGGGIQYAPRKGLYAPNQGFLPRYCDGKYEMNNSTMFVSRGLGNQSLPFRINDYPHLVCVVLEHV